MDDKKHKHRGIIAYLTNTSIEPRERILSVMLAATFFGSLVCLIPLAISGISTMWLNILLALISLVAGVIDIKYKKTDVAGAIIAFATTGVFLPAMFFTQGGYHSGMPLWFVASTIAFFILTSEKVRYFVLGLCIVVDTGCMLTEKLNPGIVEKLPTEDAEVLDIITSFLVCSLVVVLIVIVFLSTEKSQRIRLINQRAELDEKRILLEHALEFDSMTGIANRYSYNKCVEEMNQGQLGEDLIVIVADLDGLKNANDHVGHDAGDELIIGAADVLTQSFASFGQVFRIGGDEFVVILRTEQSIESLKQSLNDHIRSWRGKKLDHLQLSVGYANNREIRSDDILELQKIADQRMYEDKQEHYRGKNE